ncbi:MAG: cupin domain-containing protein [Halioglobus sp.]
MPEISVQHQCANLTDLIATESFGDPVGELPKQTDSGFFEAGNLFAGTWECEPGTMKLDLDLTEFCHLLQGHWILTSESGQVTEIRAGDSWVFPRGWKGTAEVVETVRKVYLMMIPEGEDS